MSTLEGIIKLYRIEAAAGLAHELNSPLAAIQLSLDRLGRQPGLDAAARKSLRAAQRAVERASAVVRGLSEAAPTSGTTWRSEPPLREGGSLL